MASPTGSIFRKLTLLIVSLSTITLGGYSLYILNEFRKDKEKYVQQYNLFVAESVGREIQSRLEMIRASIQSMRKVVAQSSVAEDRDRLNRYFLDSSPLILGFGLISSSPPAGETPSMDPKIEYFIENASDQKNQIDLDESQLLIKLTAALKDSKQNATTESQLWDFNPEYVVWIERFTKAGDVYSFAVVSRLALQLAESLVPGQSLEIIEPSRGTLDWKKMSYSKPSSVAQKILNLIKGDTVPSGSYRIEETTGSDWLAGFYKIQKNMLLVSRIPSEAAFDARDQLIRRSLYFAVLVMGIGILLGLFYSLSLTRPLIRLARMTEDMAAGNYTTSLAIKSNDEVGQLALCFEALGKTLEAKESELEKVTELAIKDGMTGLYNHRYFKMQMTKLFSLHQRHGGHFGICLIDVDYFKKFNDTYGHQQGDEVLRSLGALLKEVVRNTDLPARYGGEEFVVLCPETTLEGAAQMGEKIRKAYEAMPIKNLKDGTNIKSTCSLGIASTSKKKFTSIDEMIEYADQNLYRAKEAGRNRVMAL